jgi:hypothetical protein
MSQKYFSLNSALALLALCPREFKMIQYEIGCAS